MIAARGGFLGRSRPLCLIRQCLSTETQSSASNGSEIAEEESKRGLSKIWLASRGMIDPRTGELRKGKNWDYNSEVSAFAHRIGFSTKRLPSLINAFTPPQNLMPPALPPPNHTEEDPGAEEVTELLATDNSRLSSLGQSTIIQFVTEYLYCTYRHLDGGSLRALCFAVASPGAMCGLADRLGALDLLRTHHNVTRPLHTRLVSRALYAVVGAVYMDQGPTAARGLVHDFIIAQLACKDIDEMVKFARPKATLLELLRKQSRGLPEARLLRESGAGTQLPTYIVGIFSDGEQLSEAAGTSLERAQTEAILAALRNYFQQEMKQGPLPSDLEKYESEHDIKLYWSENGAIRQEETEEKGVKSSPV